MDPSLRIYKRKLKEALTLVPTMSTEQKVEAVAYWNDLAEQLQEIVQKGDSNYEQTTIIPSLDSRVDEHLASIYTNSAPIMGISADGGHSIVVPEIKLSPANQFQDVNLINKIVFENSYAESSPVSTCKEHMDNLLDVKMSSTVIQTNIPTQYATITQPNLNCSSASAILKSPSCSNDQNNLNLPSANSYAVIENSSILQQVPNHRISADNVRNTGSNLHACEVCGKAGFSTKGNLKRHLRTHSGEKPFKCEFCESCFTEKKSLKIHVRRHTGEKPYKCEICGKLFSQTGVLQSHMALHLNERKFDCQKCGKAFRQRSQLKLHLMRHDGVKRLECSTCLARFLTKGDLERHCRIHTGERPYSCKICNKTFTRQQSLNEHMNRHTGRKPYDCKYCDKTFSEMSACYKHAKTHKRQDQEQQQTQIVS